MPKEFRASQKGGGETRLSGIGRLVRKVGGSGRSPRESSLGRSKSFEPIAKVGRGGVKLANVRKWGDVKRPSLGLLQKCSKLGRPNPRIAALRPTPKEGNISENSGHSDRNRPKRD